MQFLKKRPTAGFFRNCRYKETGVNITFWKDKANKSFHPDAYYVIDRKLVAGEIFKPEKPTYLVGVCGSGGEDGWMQGMKVANGYLE